MARVRYALILLLALFGVFVGGLMTWHHDTQRYGSADEQGELIGCTESAEVNCDIVNTSAWSELAGVPIATFAIPFYATVALLAALGLRGREGVRGILLGAGVGAVAYSGFLYYVSTSELHYVCAWCLRLYGVNAAILVLSLLGGRPAMPDGSTLGTAAGVWLALSVLAVGGERAYRAGLGGEGPTPVIAKEATRLTHDPEGPAPAMSFTVTTEDKNQASFVLDPDDAWKGNPQARVAVVMFGDLECGYCKRSAAEVSRLEATYSDRVLFVFKHFPLDPACNPGVKNRKHRYACTASRAAVCAQQQGLFWPFHDLAYKNQHELEPDALRYYATSVGADGASYDACMKNSATEAIVEHDGEVGKSLDLHGTPRIFINGQLYRSGTSAEAMARAIEVALGATAAEASARAAGLREAAENIAPIAADTPSMRTLTFGETSFQIDSFEASIVDGKARSGKHQIPAIRSSWFAAKAACEAAGKRMCTEAEWVSACQNAAAVDDNHNGQLADDMIEGTAYPYGDYHDPSRCWDAKEGDSFRPVYTGEMPGCATPAGVYDLTGNVEEWVGEAPDKAVLLGGAWDTSEDHARCYRRNDTFGPGYASARAGFRCCSN